MSEPNFAVSDIRKVYRAIYLLQEIQDHVEKVQEASIMAPPPGPEEYYKIARLADEALSILLES